MNNPKPDDPGSEREALMLPTIQINKRHLPEVRADMEKAIHAMNTPPTLFVRDGSLCKILTLRNGVVEIKSVSLDNLRQIASPITAREGLVEPAFGTLNSYGAVDKSGPLLDILRCPNPSSRPTKLAKALDECVDCVFGEWRITKGPLKEGTPTYQLEQI